jgi:hypothetical protein
MMKRPDIKRKERDIILQALRAGVVPRIGLQHIQVARTGEIEQLIGDMDRISDGGAAIRFIIGDYGSGKTFFLNLVQLIALEKGLVVMSADLAPDRRLHATGGQARALFAELSRNIATRTKPEGGALPSIVERFISQSVKEAQGGNVAGVIRNKLAHLEELVGGYEFATVISRYWEGHDTDNEELKSSALRWLRAEFATRTDARKALDVRTIIDDASVYDHLKLFSAFVREAGYKGLLVSLDELVNLYKLSNSQARKSNYEQILRILNDVLQGSAVHLGFTFGGTPEFLFDTRRGMYSYEALQTRLAPNSFAAGGYTDLSGPVVQLESLSPDHLHVLLDNIRRVYLANESIQIDLPDEALHAFMQHCSQTIGDAYFRTPRNTVTAFVNMLAILEQNPSADWQGLLGSVTIEADEQGSMDHTVSDKTDDDLATFKL